ncbi:MAG: hypothetical protein ACTSPB_18635, partial [Candidatus Thorarchaeota archaeon]
DGIGYMQDAKACVDGDGAHGIIIRLIAQSELDEETIDLLAKEIDKCIVHAQNDNLVTDKDIIDVCADFHSREDMVIGMMLAAQYIQGILKKCTSDYRKKQRDQQLRSDPNLN